MVVGVGCERQPADINNDCISKTLIDDARIESIVYLQKQTVIIFDNRNSYCASKLGIVNASGYYIDSRHINKGDRYVIYKCDGEFNYYILVSKIYEIAKNTCDCK